MIPEMIKLGPAVIHTYGLILGMAGFLALELGRWVSRRERLKVTWFDQASLWAVVMGIIGARLYHVADYWEVYSQAPLRILMVWEGGLGIWGGIMGGVMGVMLSVGMRARGTSPLPKLLDIAGLVMPMAQAIGRLGNWVNQELYGLPTTLPWGIYIEPGRRLPGYETTDFYHPLFAYEAILLLMVSSGLWVVYGKKKIKFGSGGLVALYILGYSLVRGLLEGLRIEFWTVGNLPIAAALSGLGGAIALGYIVSRWRKIWISGK